MQMIDYYLQIRYYMEKKIFLSKKNEEIFKPKLKKGSKTKLDHKSI